MYYKYNVYLKDSKQNKYKSQLLKVFGLYINQTSKTTKNIKKIKNQKTKKNLNLFLKKILVFFTPVRPG